MSRMGRRPWLRMLPLVDLSVVKILLTAGTALMFATTAIRGQRLLLNKFLPYCQKNFLKNNFIQIQFLKIYGSPLMSEISLKY